MRPTTKLPRPISLSSINNSSVCPVSKPRPNPPRSRLKGALNKPAAAICRNSSTGKMPCLSKKSALEKAKSAIRRTSDAIALIDLIEATSGKS